MNVGIDRDAKPLLRLMVGEGGSLPGGPGRSGLKVVHTDVKILRRGLPPHNARPSRPLIVLVELEAESQPRLRRLAA